MLAKIKQLLTKRPGLKAREIASLTGFGRQDVNRNLHENSDQFLQNPAYEWSLARTANLDIKLGPKWIDAKRFENSLLAAGSPLDSNCKNVSFIFAESSQIMLDALARLLALCNQLARRQQNVVLDFSACKQTLGYLDRVGFIELLEPTVKILPNRPSGTKSLVYKGNNEGVVELKLIDADAPDQKIPNELRLSFIKCAGISYSDAAFTVISELFGNAQEHSRSKAAGFAGLQHYKKGRKIQTVISDVGLGIVGTLEPVLARRYPEFAQRIASTSSHKGVMLLQKVFSDGGLSQNDDDGRGIGLMRSCNLAMKYNATISVRQSDFELRVSHHEGEISFTSRLGLVPLDGTHICFDFDLTKLP